jgi:hypothetical protein
MCATAIVVFHAFYAGTLMPPESTEDSGIFAVLCAGLFVTMMNAKYLMGLLRASARTPA